MWITHLVLALSAAVTGALAVPMVRGKVPRNPYYGFRTSKTLSSDRTWYLANAYSGKQLIGASLVGIAGNLLIIPLTFFLSSGTTLLLGLAAYLVPLFVAVLNGFRFLKTL